MEFAVVIPAQEKNRYHELGDLVSFGDTTLLEWKISQCKEFIDESKIYISSSSDIIKEIAFKENVNFIGREDTEYNKILYNTISKIKSKNIIWTNVTSPFISANIYKEMIKEFLDKKDIDSLVSVTRKYDYVYYENKRLNFEEQFSSRKDLTPIDIVTNGCYIVNREVALENESLYVGKLFLFELDYLSSIEIKDMHTYQISKELISSYFRRELNV